MKILKRNFNFKKYMSSGNIVVIYDRSNPQICTVDGKTLKIRNGSTTPVKHMIFHFYSQYATFLNDLYWRDLFENASHDSFRKGYKFNGTVLSIKIKNTIKSINVTPSNINDKREFHLKYEEVKKFLSETSGISCHVDDNSVFVQLPPEKFESKGWSGTTPAKYQIAMINAFVDDVSKNYNFTDIKTKELKENITSMVYSGEITSAEIHCENFNITSIDGLYLGEGNFKIQEKPFKPSFMKKKRTTVGTTQPQNNEKHVFKCSKNLSVARRAPMYI
uniref:Uncharacterized protein n=1 Tax=viral metagenome TaxID=1070528 RepID=A0A6C0BD95_9ZZZZ